MHAALSLFTLGCWIPVWIIITVATHASNTRADANYWSRIQQYWQWELRQQQGG
jgi:hypothetical protein